MCDDEYDPIGDGPDGYCIVCGHPLDELEDTDAYAHQACWYADTYERVVVRRLTLDELMDPLFGERLVEDVLDPHRRFT